MSESDDVRLARIEERADSSHAILLEIREHQEGHARDDTMRFERIEARFNSSIVGVGKRVTKLEHWRSGLIGAWAVIATVLAYLFGHAKGD